MCTLIQIIRQSCHIAAMLAKLLLLCYVFVCRSLLNRLEQSDSKQLKLVFDSMDKNKDGHLSREELEEFAIELG